MSNGDHDPRRLAGSSKPDRILICAGLALLILYGLQVTGVLPEVTSAPGPAWNAGIALLLLTLGAVGIKKVKSLELTLGKYSFGFEAERYEPTPQQERDAIEASADNVTPDQEQKAEALVSEAKTRDEEKRSAADFLVLATDAWRAEKFDSAIDLALRGLRLEPSNARLRASLTDRLGSGYFGLGARSVTEKLHRRAVSEDPDFSMAHNNLGTAMVVQLRFDEAMDAYRTAIRLDPSNAIAHFNLGVSLREVGELDNAIESLRTTIRLKEDFAKAHSNLGETLRKLGRNEEAEASFARARELEEQQSSTEPGR